MLVGKIAGRYAKTSDGCWEWLGARVSSGYGRIYGGKGSQPAVLYAHRASWIEHFGPIPDGLYVCHRCDNKGCVNPSHLFLGDQADNMQDALSKGLLTRKLSPDQVASIRRSSGKKRDVAAQYGVSDTLVCQIQKGQTYADS